MKRPEAGVTLIELMIAITLVSALAVGMLMAMRTSLITLEKVDARLQSNRRVMSVEQILSRQIGGLIPVAGMCPGAMFRGTDQTLHMVSTYSMTEGARGYARILQYAVLPAEGGGVRLVVNESLYTGPASIAQFCSDLPIQLGPQSFVLADRLAYCHLSYREAIPESPVGGNWQISWNRPALPSAVHVEMASLVPDPARLPLVSVTVPLRITRDLGVSYFDTP
jgi:prepilin-type N-terminal cleavage/methylation domain-containing protein